MIATMTLMLTQLGLPLESIGPMTLTDIFVVNISGVIAIIVRESDLINLSHKINLKENQYESKSIAQREKSSPAL